MSELQIEKDAEWNPYEKHEALIERLQAENAELRERIKELISGDVMHEPNWSNCNEA